MRKTFAVPLSVAVFVACTDAPLPTGPSAAMRAARMESDSVPLLGPGRYVLKPGWHVRMMANGHVVELDASRRVVGDFGPLGTPGRRKGALPASYAPGYQVTALWGVPSGQYVTLDSGYWVVPPNPSAVNDSQGVFLWNGLANAFNTDTNAAIVQAVLQWGQFDLDNGGQQVGNGVHLLVPTRYHHRQFY